MLELAILGLLKERPMHGYQLSRELTGQLGGLWKVSYGSLYPTLKRLEREGLGAPAQPGGDPAECPTSAPQIARELAALDVEHMSPIDALNALWNLQREAIRILDD